MVTGQRYAEKFALLKPFSEEIFKIIKKEIKSEMQGKGSALRKKLGAASFTTDFKYLTSLITDCILSGEGEEIGEWVAVVWINKKKDIFTLFHEHLVEVSEDYSELTTLPAPVEEKLIQDSIEKFGAKNTYIFSLLNSVVFSAQALERLENLAKQ